MNQLTLSSEERGLLTAALLRAVMADRKRPPEEHHYPGALQLLARVVSLPEAAPVLQAPEVATILPRGPDGGLYRRRARSLGAEWQYCTEQQHRDARSSPDLWEAN